MAEEKNKKVAVPAPVEDKYTVQELIFSARKVFGVPVECATAALLGTDKKEMTVSEAKAVIDAFMKKEVK